MNRGQSRGQRRSKDESAYWEFEEALTGTSWEAPKFKADAASAELEALVFGKRSNKEVPNGQVEINLDTSIFNKRKRKQVEEAEIAEEESSDEEDDKPKVAWEDPDDAALELNLDKKVSLKKMKRNKKESKISGVEYVSRQRAKFLQMHGDAPAWAAPKEEEDASEDSDVEKAVPSSKPLVKQRKGLLPPTELDWKELKEVNVSSGGEMKPSIQTVQFHPEGELLLTSGHDRTLRLFAVDGVENPKVASYHMKNFPIWESTFLPGGGKVLMAGGSALLWTLDVATGETHHLGELSSVRHGRYYGLTPGPDPAADPSLRSSRMCAFMGDQGGQVMLCDAASMLVVRTFKMSAKGTAAVFAPGRDLLYTADADNSIYEWDIGTGRCRHRFTEPWATGITSLAACPASATHSKGLLAVGTNTGNIDFFELGEQLPRTPFKSIDNLRTGVRAVRFHGSGELCAGFSDEVKDAIKLIHTPTMTVFKNFGDRNTGTVRAVAFGGARMAMGTTAGRVRLFQLNHFEAGI